MSHTLDADRWQRIETLFRQALERLPEDRPDFLRESCGDDTRLHGRLLALIEADAQAGDFLEEPLSLAEPDPERERIGPYRLIRILGQGGSSTVYLAQRDDGYERKVAIKVMRQEAARGDLLRRFLVERQILASLEHPYIARLLDGDTTDEGRPYFVLEHVEGEPLDVYCNRHRLQIGERIELFRKVCQAVHHAHRHLVVHRDLKPANILVTAEGHPKLLDFGIAKILDPQTFPRPVARTLTGLRPMTPLYASPEQVGGEPVTTASDVYSLGVILYQVLTGELPHDLPSGFVAETERRIREHRPEPPSQVAARIVREDPTAAARLASARQISPSGWARELSGDLDAVILQALRKEPERRYSSVEQLAEDLLAVRQQRPVRARGDSVRYRVSRFVRRHRLGVAAAALFFVMLAAFSFVVSVQAIHLGREQIAVKQERDKAVRVAELMEEIFAASKPWATRADAVTARELLDRGAERVRRELEDQPEIRAELLETIGRSYTALGLYDPAESILTEALEIRRRHLEATDPEVADSLRILGELQGYRQELERAEALLREALDILGRSYGRDHPEIADTVNHLGVVLGEQGRLEVAIHLLEQAAESRRLPAADPVELAETLINLGVYHEQLGDYPEAARVLEEALQILEDRFGSEHVEIARALNVLSIVVERQGDLAESERLLTRALEIRRKLLGEDHPDFARAASNLAILLRRRGELERAEAMYYQALETQRRGFGEGHPEIARTLNNLGVLLRYKGDLEASEARHREALAIRREVYGPRHPDVAISLANLASSLAAQDRLEEAEALLRQGIDIRSQTLGERHPDVAWDLHDLGRILHRKGQLAEAESVLRQALGMRRETLGESHPQVAATLEALAKVLTGRGATAEAEEMLQLAETIQEGSKVS